MAVFRIHKEKNYTVISNSVYKDKTISLKAKGLLSLMLSLPDDWDYSIEGLTKLSSDGETSIRSGLKELEEHKYLIRTPLRESGKIIDWEYNIFEIPTISQVVENQQVENQVVENIDNKVTNKLSNKELSKKDSIINNTIVVNTNSQNFTFGTKQTKPKKQNLYSRCVALINNKTDDKELQKLLVDWLNMILEKYRDREKVLYENVFKGKLNTLDEYDKKDWKDIIQYNLQRGYEAFYPIKEYKHNDMEVISSEYGIVNSYKYTDEERKRQEEWRAEMKRNGKRIEF